MTQYTIEWVMESSAVDDDLDRQAMMESVVAEFDENIEPGGPVRRLSESALLYVSIGTFVVSSAKLLLEIYRLLKDKDGSDVGVIKSDNGNQVFAGDYEEQKVKEVGGNIIGTVEDDAILVEFTSKQVTEFNKLRDTDEEDDYSEVEALVNALVRQGYMDEEEARDLVESSVSNNE